MYALIHWIILIVYCVLPVLVLAGAVVRGNREVAVARFVMSAIAGIVIGIAMNLVNAAAAGGTARLGQILLAGYFATSMLLFLKLLDALLQRGVRWALRLPAGKPAEGSDAHGPRPVRLWRMQWAMALRVLVLFGIGLPYVMAAVMTYRPKVTPGDDPLRQMGFAYESVQFQATDGVRLSGWWIPALSPIPGQQGDEWGRRTVIVCHGLAANKSNQLVMARQLVPSGYNVLIFDFRAHGESGGQLTSFGDFERRDVLGAVKWLHDNRAEASRRIFGVGASMGAAALIAAAADDSEEGRAIEAIAVYGAYADMRGLTDSVAHRYFFPPFGWLARYVGLPIANAQVGTNLLDFAPADLVDRIWPRPIFIIHGRDDEIIAFEQGAALFKAAAYPKFSVFPMEGDHNGIIVDDNLARAVRVFFDVAEPVPVI